MCVFYHGHLLPFLADSSHARATGEESAKAIQHGRTIAACTLLRYSYLRTSSYRSDCGTNLERALNRRTSCLRCSSITCFYESVWTLSRKLLLRPRKMTSAYRRRCSRAPQALTIHARLVSTAILNHRNRFSFTGRDGVLLEGTRASSDGHSHGFARSSRVPRPQGDMRSADVSMQSDNLSEPSATPNAIPKSSSCRLRNSSRWKEKNWTWKRWNLRIRNWKRWDEKFPCVRCPVASHALVLGAKESLRRLRLVHGRVSRAAANSRGRVEDAPKTRKVGARGHRSRVGHSGE